MFKLVLEVLLGRSKKSHSCDLPSPLWPLSYILSQKSIHISYHSWSLVICLQVFLSPFHFYFSRVWTNIWLFFWHCRGYSGYSCGFSLDSWKLTHLIFHFEADFLILPLLCSPLLFPFVILYKTPSWLHEQGAAGEEHSGRKCECWGHFATNELHLCLHVLIHKKHIN